MELCSRFFSAEWNQPPVSFFVAVVVFYCRISVLLPAWSGETCKTQHRLIKHWGFLLNSTWNTWNVFLFHRRIVHFFLNYKSIETIVGFFFFFLFTAQLRTVCTSAAEDQTLLLLDRPVCYCWWYCTALFLMLFMFFGGVFFVQTRALVFLALAWKQDRQ